ncbi:hypothetical protein [Streptomyces sp. NPDC059003]|uniref:hypothetical protein n=1 Tax=Streptomyces sp. NPDC059003 TaxID=3346691 RepID=UPI0036931AF9
MSSSFPQVQVHILTSDEDAILAPDEDVDLVDVGVVNINGERHLFISPQNFERAVRQVSSAMPDVPLEQVERLLREHCPELKDFDELMGSIETAPPIDAPPLPLEMPPPARVGSRVKKWVIAAMVLPALVGAWELGHVTRADPASNAASTPDANPTSDKANSDNRNLGPKPFVAQEFMEFSDAGKIDCSPTDNLEAECTDADGMVMSTKAATGPDSTIFTFSYGHERIGLRIFGTARYAKTWTLQDGSRELYPNMSRSGRYVLWGTDEERLKEYRKLLEASAGQKPGANTVAYTMGGAEPLPPRLAALTLGTLGLDHQEVRSILITPQDTPIDAPLLMAAQAVLGTGEVGTGDVKPGAEDIVALAAGIGPSLGVTEPGGNTHGNGGVVHVISPARPGSTASGGSPGASTATTAARPGPAPYPKQTGNEKQRPVKPTFKPEKPVAEKPTAPKPKPKPKPEQPPTEKPEEPPTEPEQPPTEPVDPTPPVTETPTPPGPEETRPPADGDGTATKPPAQDGDSPMDDTADEDREPLIQPQGRVAPAV